MTSGFDIALPRWWSISRLKRATVLLNRGTAPEYVDEGPVRAVGQAANQAAGLDWTRTRFHNFSGDAKRLKGYLIPGDVLINSTGTGTLGRVGYFENRPDDRPCVADGHVTVARADPQVVDSRYLYYWLTSRAFYGYIYSALIVGATNQIELNREKLADAAIGMPTIGEQRRIAEFLDAETLIVDSLVQQRTRQRELLDELKQGATDDAVERLNGWPWPRLGYLARVQTGVTVDGSRQPVDGCITVPYLRLANVQAGYLDLNDVAEMTVPRIMPRKADCAPATYS
jgi:type I restriction enzyme, S subunit